MTKMGFKWNEHTSNIKGNLRPHNSVKREIMVDNFCKVKEINKEVGINKIAEKIKGDILDIDLPEIISPSINLRALINKDNNEDS